jgi:hypothetical protein
MQGRHVHLFVKREKNSHLRSAHAARIARSILDGNRLAGLAATVNFFLRQRRAYMRWQSDSDLLKRSSAPRETAPLGGA